MRNSSRSFRECQRTSTIALSLFLYSIITVGVRRLPEKEIQDVDAVGGDVVKRSSARTGGVQKPRAWRVCGDRRGVAGGPREDRLANRAAADQLHGAMDLGVCAAIVCY